MDIAIAFEKGGVLMWIILGCSLIGTFVFIERMLALQRSKVLPVHLYRSLLKHLKAGDTERAEALCRESQSILSRVAEVGLKYRRADRAVVKEVMEEVGQIEVGYLSVRIDVLSTVAAIAPLLGLLGTVAGMIEVFDDLKGPEVGSAAAAAATATGPSIEALAQGIEHALFTTLGGLAIAIPFYVAYRYIETRIERFALELEEVALMLLNELVPPVLRAEAAAEGKGHGNGNGGTDDGTVKGQAAAGGNAGDAQDEAEASAS